jgi:hypothetical protein
MKRIIGGLFGAVVVVSAANSLSFEVERKIGAPLKPARRYSDEASDPFYTLISDFHEHLAGLTRLSAGADVNLNVDNFGVYYAAKIYLGSQRKMFNVQLDTGSNILVI